MRDRPAVTGPFQRSCLRLHKFSAWSLLELTAYVVVAHFVGGDTAVGFTYSFGSHAFLMHVVMTMTVAASLRLVWC